MRKGKIIKILSAAFLTSALLMTAICAMAKETDNHLPARDKEVI